MACLLDRSFCRQVCHIIDLLSLRMSHILHCCQRSTLPLLPFRSAPRSERFASMSTRSLMIHPIDSGGATRKRHCSLLGGATRARSDADTCVLPSDATCTRHDDAFSSKRLTVPCDSDFLCVSLIRDGLSIATRLFDHSAQHNFLGQFFCCSRCVLPCTQSFRVCLASV